MTSANPDPEPAATAPVEATLEQPTKVGDPNAADRDRHADAVSQVAPDFAEQEMLESIDNIVPTRGYDMPPMVALGGSAGSIQALQTFFRAMPGDSGMVFVVVLHLSPDHHSTLADLLGRVTTMPVAQAEDGQKVESNHIYVIPPGKHLVTVDGHLRLFELEREKGKRVAVDLFFRSMADTHGPHGAAVVLSGADSDGAIGIKRIKERGGLTIAQDPNEAEHDSMPRNSIETGMVDWVLQVDQMPNRLLAYFRNEFALRLPAEDGPQPAQTMPPAFDEAETALRGVLAFLRTRTGRDFTYYKRATILRRIGRRMQINAIADLPGYLDFLRTQPGEPGALLQDMLISVTNFFRDREAFKELERQVIPQLFEGKGQGDTLRVWVPACATGEEAYSITMLLLEHARKMTVPPVMQVFACDLDEEAIREARSGLYSNAIAADVSEERLQRFFIKEPGGYRVRRDLREMVLFAVHDLLKDAPFSRLDLVSCRNLMIYLNREAQNRALHIFHFALNSNGRLFLGSSESVDEGNPFFRVVDKKYRLHAVQPVTRTGLPVSAGPGTLQRIIDAHTRTSADAPVVASNRLLATNPVFGLERPQPLDRAALAEMHFRLVERLSPPSIVVDADYGIVHLSERAGKFLEFTGGQPTNDLLRLVDQSLRLDLRAALFRAAESNAPVEVISSSVILDGQSRIVDLRVSPAFELAPGFLLVVFSVRPEGAAETPTMSSFGDEPIARQFERELDHVRGQLRGTVEQYEASNEEMKASNEELQAMNEELRSASEELETSREELQSINEELVTVNQEMKSKVDELAQTNDDLQNLMASTSIATLFLDRDMVITRYTPSVTGLFYMIPSDVGRPLAHIKHRLAYPEIFEDAARVLRSLTPFDREVSSDNGSSYSARFHPYRTLENHIAGVVITFVDVSERKRVERALEDDLEASERLRKASERLVPEGDMQALYEEILDAAIVITGAVSGTLQLLDPSAPELRLLAAKGLSPAMAKRFETVAAGSSTVYGRALASGQQTSEDFEPGATVATGDDLHSHFDAGLRSAQSTPLMSRSGRPIGMLATFWREHRRLSERERRFLDLLARQAADAMERQLANEILHGHMEELTRFHDAVVDREGRMMELKQEINALLSQRGEPRRYSIEPERTDNAR